MKHLLVILSSIFILSSVFAETVTVDVPAGYNAILVSNSIHHSGCGNKIFFLSVIKSNDRYIAGNDLGVKHNNPITKDLMPVDIQPLPICGAVVTTTYTIRIEHMDLKPETIEIEVPDSIVSLSPDLKIEIQDIHVVH